MSTLSTSLTPTKTEWIPEVNSGLTQSQGSSSPNHSCDAGYDIIARAGLYVGSDV